MKIMLTSFAISAGSAQYGAKVSPFFRMPPVSMWARPGRQFTPAYEALVLCDRATIDTVSLDRLMSQPPDVYGEVAETLHALLTEGFLDVIDYSAILSRHQALLDEMLKQDLSAVEQWVDALRESRRVWREFAGSYEHLLGVIFCGQIRGAKSACPNPDIAQAVRSKWPSDVPLVQRMSVAHVGKFPVSPDQEPEVDRVLASTKARRSKDGRDLLRRVASDYLSYVNANVVLSNALGLGFHDWGDFQPFYRRKFLSVGRTSVPPVPHVAESTKLFQISFPRLAITAPTRLIKVLTDKRVASLRQLVQDAVDGKVEFDKEFAERTLFEVFRLDRMKERCRKLTSYITPLLGLIPWAGPVVEKATEKAIDSALDYRLKRQYRWFYMLSDYAEQAKVPSAETQPEHEGGTSA